MQVAEQTLSPKVRARLLMLVIASSTTLVLAVVLVIVLTLESFTGITSTAPLLLNSCASTYYSLKYSTPNHAIIIVYLSSLLSIFLEVAVCVLVFPPLIMRVQPDGRRLSAAYLLVSAHTLSVLVAFGKNLAYQIDLHSMDASCSVSYSEVLIQIILACAAADFFVSLLQAVFMHSCVRSFISECEKAQRYQLVTNFTNQTVENRAEQKKAVNLRERMPIEIPTGAGPFESGITPHRQYLNGKVGPAKPPNFERKGTEFAQTYKEPVKGRFDRRDAEALQSSHNEMNLMQAVDRREHYEAGNSNEVIRPAHKQQNEAETFIEKYAQAARNKFNRANSSFEEESQQSLAKERKATLDQVANAPGPIYSANKTQQTNRNTRGYLNFVRRMNANENQIVETEGELIATIKGKYGK